MTGVFECSLSAGELLSGIEVPRLSPDARWGYFKHCRKTGELAHAIGAYLHDPARAICRAVIGATGTKPIVFSNATALFDGKDRRCDQSRRRGTRDDRKRDGRSDRATNSFCLSAAGGRAGAAHMSVVSLTINGRAVSAEVEPRTHLADFIRETQNLTGTHLGCEHGVCGACTVLVDGVPVRSCITYAVACGGASVTTIEGLDDDEIGKELRTAFSREHALQCGYCTPGMLVSARDVVLRAQAPIRTRHPRRDERQSLPMHRLCRHYSGNPERHC